MPSETGRVPQTTGGYRQSLLRRSWWYGKARVESPWRRLAPGDDGGCGGPIQRVDQYGFARDEGAAPGSAGDPFADQRRYRFPRLHAEPAGRGAGGKPNQDYRRHIRHEAVANHFSLAVNEDGTRFLLNPRHRHFTRISASDFLLLDGFGAWT